MDYMYQQMKDFMGRYFPAYSDLAQFSETQKDMDEFYAPDIMFDDGFMAGREQWYRACLSHPGIQDKMVVNDLCIDSAKMKVSAWITSKPTVIQTGEVLLEIDMHALYTLKKDENSKLSISRIQVFLESNPDKAIRMMEIYREAATNSR